MRYSVGYRLSRPGERSFVEIVREFQAHVAEVYYPWVEMPSGRAPLQAEHREQLVADLRALRQLGVRLNLVLNASCHGPEAFSQAFAARLRALLEELSAAGLVDAVTTMSPLAAQVIKSGFPHIRTRASVNMRLGTTEAFEYVADLFDGFNLQRDHQRDLARVAAAKAWCDRRGKTLHLLANSGCLAWCAVQSFHDNLVAHEAEIDHAACVRGPIPGSCWDYLRDRRHWAQFLKNTWIRPEDTRHYEPYVPELKLATRMHARPRTVLKAYAEGHYSGNLLDLLEPSHTGLLLPYVLDNTRFPADFFVRSTAPGTPEEKDQYFADVLGQVLINLTRQ